LFSTSRNAGQVCRHIFAKPFLRSSMPPSSFPETVSALKVLHKSPGLFLLSPGPNCATLLGLRHLIARKCEAAKDQAFRKLFLQGLPLWLGTVTQTCIHHHRREAEAPPLVTVGLGTSSLSEVL